MRKERHPDGTPATPLDYCPSCAHGLNVGSAVEPEGVVPKPGNISICAYCGAVLEFDADLRVLPISAETTAALTERQYQGLKKLSLAVRAFNANWQAAGNTFEGK